MTNRPVKTGTSTKDFLAGEVWGVAFGSSAVPVVWTTLLLVSESSKMSGFEWLAVCKDESLLLFSAAQPDGILVKRLSFMETFLQLHAAWSSSDWESKRSRSEQWWGCCVSGMIFLFLESVQDSKAAPSFVCSEIISSAWLTHKLPPSIEVRSSKAMVRTKDWLLISVWHSEASRLIARWESTPVHSGLPLLAVTSPFIFELQLRSSEALEESLSLFPHSPAALFLPGSGEQEAPMKSVPSSAAPSSAGFDPLPANANSPRTPQSGFSNLFGKQINDDIHSTCFPSPHWK